MTKYKFLLSVFLLTCSVLTSLAQSSGNNSSYSRFGLGILNDQSQGFNKGMAGVSQGIRLGNRVNMQNPASYSEIDSLSFIFDVGMNLSMGRMTQGNNRINVKNAGLDYVNAGLRLTKGLGLSFGFVPFTTIGYNFYTQDKVGNDAITSQPINTLSSYYGEGGLHQMYVGAGWNPFLDLSIGANINFIWGTYEHVLKQTFGEGTETSNSNYSGLNSIHHASIRTYKIDLGAQYPIRLTPDDVLTLGATVGIGHNIKSDATLIRHTSVGDSIEATANNPFDLPYTYSAGASWQHKDNLLVAADIKHERWAECGLPAMSTNNNDLIYTTQKGGYQNRTKVAIGAQFTPNAVHSKYINRIQYRIGASFSTPYLKINGQDGPKEYCISAGAGLPISNSINKRSIVNVNLQWLRRAASATNMITENYIMINVGMTFNEMWFMKFKIK